MKNIIALLFILSITYGTKAQVLSNVDQVTTFHEGLAAVKKGDAWGFIDTTGTVIVDFRKDIVASEKEPPVFSNGLCLISATSEGITYFGYIDATGKIVIPAEYLAAMPFENGFARVIKYYKTYTGATNALGKNIVTYSYNELVIDTYNKTVQHLRGPNNLLFDSKQLKRNPPTIQSKFISKNLIAAKQDDNTYSIFNLNKK